MYFSSALPLLFTQTSDWLSPWWAVRRWKTNTQGGSAKGHAGQGWDHQWFEVHQPRTADQHASLTKGQHLEKLHLHYGKDVKLTKNNAYLCIISSFTCQYREKGIAKKEKNKEKAHYLHIFNQTEPDFIHIKSCWDKW